MKSEIGRKVVVIFSDPRYAGSGLPFPPIGAIGEIVSDIDEFYEYDILFYEHPCNSFGDPTWITHKSMIVFLDEEGKENFNKEFALTA